MSNRLCLFEERLGDKRFREREKEILAVCLEEDVSDVDTLAKKAGISRATVYRHHETMSAMVGDYEELIEARVERKFEGVREMTARKFYREALFFVLQNREVFDFLEMWGRRSPFLSLMEYARVVVRQNRIFRDEMIYQIYAAEIVAVLEMWQKSGFDEEMIEEVLGNILYLTETAGIRLSPLKR